MCSMVEAEGLLAELRAADLSVVGNAALAAELVALRGLIDSVEAEWLRRLEVFDQRRGPADMGAASTGAWVRGACRLSPGIARGRVELARSLPSWANTAAALAAGEISSSHAQHIVIAADELAAVAGSEIAADAEPAMVELARRVDPARLRHELAHVRHALAPEAAAEAAEVAHRRRRLSVSETFDGMVAVDGLLDPEGGALLLSALMPLAGRCGPDDQRSPRQRRADGLVELCRRQLDAGNLPAVGGERPHINVVVELATLEHRVAVGAESPAAPGGAAPANDGPVSGAAAGEPRRETDVGPLPRPESDVGPPPQRGSDAAPVPWQGSDAAPPSRRESDLGPASRRESDPAPSRADRIVVAGPRAAETAWAGPLCGEAARRLACDAAVARVITDGASQPLDVGRRTRTIPAAIRTALVVRDAGCAFPGCDRPPGWTDAHHLQHWVDGGPTSVTNLVLLCRAHHRTVHEGGWQLARGADGRWAARPPGRAGSASPFAA
jgi:hypothetical protein